MRAPSAKPWAPWAPLASGVSQVQLHGNGRQGIPTLQLSCGRACLPEALTGLWGVRRPGSQSGGTWGHLDPCSGTTVGPGRAPWVTPGLQGDSGAPHHPHPCGLACSPPRLQANAHGLRWLRSAGRRGLSHETLHHSLRWGSD